MAPEKRILVVEQAMFLSQFTNDHNYHPFMLWENIEEKYPGTGLVRIEMCGTDDNLKSIIEEAAEFDVIVATNMYSRGAVPNTGFLEKMIKAIKDKPVIIVSNSPFPVVVTDSMDTAFCIFSEMPESLKVAADIITGSFEPQTEMPFKYIM